MKKFDNISVLLWLAMDIAWSYDLIVLPIVLGISSAVFQFIRFRLSETRLDNLESAASFYWILANVAWCADLMITKSVFIVLSVITTILVLIENGKLKRGA